MAFYQGFSDFKLQVLTEQKMRPKNLLLLIFSIFIILSAIDLHAEDAKKHSLGFDFGLFDFGIFLDSYPGFEGEDINYFNLNLNLAYDHHFVKYFSLGVGTSFFYGIPNSPSPEMRMKYSFRISLRLKAIVPFNNDKVEFYCLARSGIIFADSSWKRTKYMIGPSVFFGLGIQFKVYRDLWVGFLTDGGVEFGYYDSDDCVYAGQNNCTYTISAIHPIRAFLTFNYRF